MGEENSSQCGLTGFLKAGQGDQVSKEGGKVKSLIRY